MEEIRNDFHNLANCLNNISINAGIIVETVKLKDIDGMSEKETKEKLREALAALTKAVDSALKAGEIISKLRKKVYEALKIDTSKPVE